MHLTTNSVWLVLSLAAQVAITGRRTWAAASAAQQRTKVWPSAPCDIPGREGCSTRLSPRGKSRLAELCKGCLLHTYPWSSSARKEDATAEPSGQEPDRLKDLLPKGQMKEFSYLNSPSHHVPWCYETRLWLRNTKPHESIWPQLFHSHIGTLQLQTTQALGQLGFSFNCFELIQIRCPISLCIKTLKMLPLELRLL